MDKPQGIQSRGGATKEAEFRLGQFQESMLARSIDIVGESRQRLYPIYHTSASLLCQFQLYFNCFLSHSLLITHQSQLSNLLFT